MMRSRYGWITAPLLAVLAGPVLGAGYGVTERWRDPSFTGSEFARLLVVGITTDSEVRHRFEDKLVTQLRARHEALTSYSFVADLSKVRSPGEVAQQLVERDVAGILMVSLVPIADEKALTDWAASWLDLRQTETTARASLEHALTRSQTAAPRYAVEVELWDTASRRRVWSGRTDAHKRKAWRDGASEMVQSVIAALREDRLLP